MTGEAKKLSILIGDPPAYSIYKVRFSKIFDIAFILQDGHEMLGQNQGLD